MTLNNEKQKVNDLLGNPIIIGVVVIWKVIDATKAVFNVDNYNTFYQFNVIQLFVMFQDFIHMMCLKMVMKNLFVVVVKR